MTNTCPVCWTLLLSPPEERKKDCEFDCPRCGQFVFARDAIERLPILLKHQATDIAKLSHALRKIPQVSRTKVISLAATRALLENASLPKPPEQLENLILYLGDHQERPGVTLDLNAAQVAWIGSIDFSDLGFIVQSAIEKSLVYAEIRKGFSSVPQAIQNTRLSFAGWEYYQQLRNGRGTSRTAFMAMQFNDVELDSFVRNYLSPAVAVAGFELRRIDDGQPAGLIDDRLRVAIRQARFLIADLTHHNRGAYWEAGYAEGLGKPVIYTCRRDIFEDKTQGTHFDTNHHLTVVWSPDDLQGSAEKLTATIRATLPDLATL